MRRQVLISIVVFLLLGKELFAQPLQQAEFVSTPKRDIPIIAEVDVLVVGGTTGGVAAAVSAAEQGASVFLVAPYPYLGEDMTATLRLWLEPGEDPTQDPLALAVYHDTNRGQPSKPIEKDSYSFTYTTEGKIGNTHPELKNNPPGRLGDRQWNNPTDQSLQIDGDAVFIAKMDAAKDLEEVDLVAFYREGDFVVAGVTYSCSDDGENWRTLGTVTYDKNHVGHDFPLSYALTFDQPLKTQYIKAEAKRMPGCERLLFGELFLVPYKEKLATVVAENHVDAPPQPMFPPPRPLHVKKVLDDALLDARVDFLFSSYVTSVVKEKDADRICGIVISNRQGEQIILAKTVIDASLSPNVLLAGYNQRIREALFVDSMVRSRSPLEFVVVGGEPQMSEATLGFRAVPQIMGIYNGPWPNDAKTESGVHRLIRYRVMPVGGRWQQEHAENFEAKLQLATYHPDIQQQADAIWLDHPSDLSALIPTLERSRFAMLSNPKGRAIDFMTRGREVGTAFAKTALTTPKLDKAKLLVGEIGTFPFDATDINSAVKKRPEMEGAITKFPTLTVEGTNFPVMQKYDVVVVGGGTSGAPAAIAAARQGANVLLLEYLHGLGGIGTEGAIANYYWGNRVGFTAEVQGGQAQWVIEQKKQWWRQACFEANVQMTFGVMGTEAIVSADNPNKVTGVVYAAEGRKIPVLADVVIDATGNGDIAFAAGAQPMYITAGEIAVQGTGLPPKELGGRYRNTDYAFVDETDIFDVTHIFIYAKEKFPNAFDLARIVDTRERRRILGDYVLTVLDQINERTYPDTIVQARSDFDSHGYTIDPYLEIEHPDRKGFYSYLPYRTNLPKGLDGILVAGLATSCERDAIPLMRMQPDLQNQGYALGVIAATAVKDGVDLRQVDIRKVQQHLVQVGNLSESVLTDTDNYEAKRAGLAEAVKKLPETETFDGAHLVFWYPEEGKKLVRNAFDADTDKMRKARYAQVLAVMGDPVGVDLLIEKVRAFDQWDAGWNFRGMGQFGSALSPLDRLILALGRAGDKCAVPVIAEKLNLLTHNDDFSHYRACSIALELLGDPAAIPALTAALEKPNVTGYVHGTIEIAKKWDQADPQGATAEKSRRDSLLEIGLARALYRLGDNEAKLGRTILTDYAENDLRGHFSRHARLVLAQ
ncbi:MAG: FAD-dependent oxidoreductase [Planctomycetaceae bacterium]|nr:FAD-dependent oxidoreductase [Planctomycetaceae bacterium]